MIKGNKMSLTKKLDGGYLHVKKSPIKSSVNANKGGYNNYLNKNNTNGSKKEGGQRITNDNSKKVDPDEPINFLK